MQIKGEYLNEIPGPFTQIDSKKIRETAEEYIKSLDIRCFGPTQHSGTLSGGNQQKVCIAKALCMSPKFLFVSEPTRGIDIGSEKVGVRDSGAFKQGTGNDRCHCFLRTSGA